MKYNLFIFALWAVGIGCLVSFHAIGGTIDAQGLLHEPFFLLPIGYLFITLGAISAVGGMLRRA